MPTDWSKPFPRNAVFISKPDSELPFFVRPPEMENEPIKASIYASLEAERQDWYSLQVEQARDQRELQMHELRIKRERRMVRDSMEVTADAVLAKLATWKKWADIDRWRQLGEWIDKHPQRWSEIEDAFSLVDNVDWEDPILSVIPEAPPPKKGRPKGTPNSPESNQLRSEAAKKLWAERKASGWKYPKQEPEQRREAPY